MPDFSAAIAHAQAHEVPWPRDPREDPLRFGVHQADPEPWNQLRGPLHPRGGVSGVIRIAGREMATWGEPDRPDQTFSVAKTFLGLLAGVAHARGLLPDAQAPVGAQLPGIGFDDGNNAQVTWAQLMEQTSDWTGTVFGIPDQVDHFRPVSHDPKPPQGRKGDRRVLQPAGTHWEYNDVRINQLSLALLHLFRRPLQDVFREAVLAPLGAGGGFRWEPYDDAFVTIGGERLPSVPGGTHWGGGVSISARDQAAVGQLLLDGGVHAGQQLVPSPWIARMQQPCAIAPFYGWLVWLNNGGALFADAPHDSFFMIGAGGHYVWILPSHQAVVVVRWLDPAHSPGFVTRVMRALKARAG